MELIEGTAKIVKMKKKLKTIGIKFVAVLLVIGAALIIGSEWQKGKSTEIINDKDRIIEEMDAIIDKYDESPIVVSPIAPRIDLDIIQSEIEGIGELASVEYMFTDAAAYSDSKYLKKLKIPGTEKSFVIKWDGVIKAGIDLEQISPEIIESTKTIEISLPAAKILSYEVNQDSVEVVDEKNNLLNQITIEDKVGFDKKTENAMKERAIENGLLEKAQANAEDILFRLVNSLPGVKDNYTITFTTIS